MADAQSQTVLRKHAETPQPLERDEDGKIVYPRTDEGTAGSVYTYDEKKRGDLPADTGKLQIPNSDKTETDLLAAATVTGAMMAGERKSAATPALPPYVQTNKTEFGTAYTFVSPVEAREAGFEPSVLLGVDDGSGTGLGAITEKAYALVAQMDATVKKQGQDATRGNPTVGTAAGGNASKNIPPMPDAWAMDSKPADEMLLMTEFQRQEDVNYQQLQDKTAHEVTHIDNPLEDKDDDNDASHAFDVLAAVPVLPEAGAVKQNGPSAEQERLALLNKAALEGRSVTDEEQQPAPEAPAPK